MLSRTVEHRHADFAAAAVMALLDLLLVGGQLALGMDGIFTADWMGYPGPMHPEGATYQAGVVEFTTWACAVTVGLALVCRGWATAATQVVLLGGGALYLGSLPTYWSG
ncbi:hypothetical protein ACWD01_21915 [Streptomyces sp. NPDC002835]|jgi:hypothetical protein